MTIKTSPNWKVSSYNTIQGSKKFPTYNTVRQSRNFSHWRDGLENPNHREQIAKGENACTVFSAEKRDLISLPSSGPFVAGYGVFAGGDYNYRSVDGDVFGYTASLLPFDLADYSTTTATNLAIAKFLGNVKASKQKIAGGVVLGELKETVRMLRSPLKSLFRAFETYRKSVVKGKRLSKGNARAFTKAARESWLEFQFGVKPLINDIRDGAKAYVEIFEELEERPPWTEIKGVGKWKTVTQSSVQSSFGGISPLFTQEDARRSWECIVVLRGKIKSSIACAPVSTAQKVVDTLGLGPEEWLPTAWELIPFSFVVDYFTNVGDILSSITTSRGDILWVNQTKLYVRSEFLSGKPDPKRIATFMASATQKELSIPGELGWALSVTTRVYRAPLLDTNFYPTLEWKFPPGDSLKWLNLAALTGGFAGLAFRK